MAPPFRYILAAAAAAVVLAVVVPSLRRARRSSVEAPTGDLRTINAAQQAYASANEGFFDGRLDCLVRPSACIPGYAATAPTFLLPQLAEQGLVRGYTRSFHPGPAASPSTGSGRRSPTSVACWAMTATPSSEVGMRSYCVDCSGEIHYREDGRTPGVRDGTCDASDPRLR
jgi:hypothetical protein